MAQTKRTVRHYTDDERAAVLARIGAGERQVDVARELDIPASTIRKWVQQAGEATSPLHQPTYAELMAQNQALRADLSRTQEEVDLLKKASAYSEHHQRVLTVADKTKLVAEYAGFLSIARRCAALGIDDSTYYRHRQQVVNAPRTRWECERAAIQAYHTAVHGRVGRRGVHAWLVDEGHRIGYGTTHRLMQELKLRARRGDKKAKSQGINDEAVTVRNLLQSEQPGETFSSPAPGQRLVGDSTEIVWERRGMRLHVHVVLDLYNRAVVGWATSARPDARSAIAAMEMARKNGAIHHGTIFHSDHGSQYMSNAFRDYCLAHGVRQSMGERHTCYDNPVAESFFATLKGDCPNLKATFPTTADLAIWIHDYIEAWYNRRRPHSWNNGKPPLHRRAETTTTTTLTIP